MTRFCSAIMSYCLKRCFAKELVSISYYDIDAGLDTTEKLFMAYGKNKNYEFNLCF